MNEEALKWLRREIEARAGLARNAVRLGSAEVWAEQSSGVLVTGKPTDEDVWHGTYALGDSSVTRLMEANDPRDTIARCEAELAIVDLCARVIRDDEGERYWSDGWAGLGVAQMVLGGIASAYRHRAGYDTHWPAAVMADGA